MANQRLFIQNATNEHGLVGRSTTMTYDVTNGHLTIWRRGRRVVERFGVNDGDAFIVSCNRSRRVTVTDFLLSKNNWGALMRLLGFSRKQQTASLTNYENARYDYRYTRLSTLSGVEKEGLYEISKKGYMLMFANKSGRADKRMMAYAEPGIQVTDRLVFDLLYSYHGKIDVPKYFFYKVLRERFGFDEQDIEDVDLLEKTGDICYSDSYCS